MSPYNILTDPIFTDFCYERNLSKNSIKAYKSALQDYCQYHQMTLQELLNEADLEEEQGVRAKNRKIIRRLKDYRTHLIQKDTPSRTVTGYYTRVRTLYRHNLIELPYIPPVKLPVKQKLYHEMPHKEDIINILEHTSNLKHRAIIYFMASSGTARQEVSNMTVNDFITATHDYHKSETIYLALEKLETMDNVIPLFALTRQKTKYKYWTLCTMETTRHILKYLKQRGFKELKADDKLFNVTPNAINKIFSRLNDSCGYPKGFFHPHSLRKYHADILQDWDLTNRLQGRKNSAVREAYDKVNPTKLKQRYKRHIEDLTLQPSKVITIESDEVRELKRQHKKELEALDATMKQREAVMKTRVQLIEAKIEELLKEKEKED